MAKRSNKIMKKSIKNIFVGVMLVTLFVLGASTVLPTSSVYSKSASDISNDTNPGGGIPTDLGTMITTIINTALYAIGIVCVIMIIYGGFLYTVTGGDQAKVTNAKNTIMYAVVGLVVAVMAYAIVNWVLGPAFLGVNQ